MSDTDWIMRAIADAAMARAKSAILADPSAFKVYGLKAPQIAALRKKFCADYGVPLTQVAEMSAEEIDKAVRR